MNHRSFPVLCLILLLALVLMPLSGAAEDSYSAGTMRLLRYGGDVTILNSDGVSRFVMENVRFESGESLRTGADGSASIGLDDSKIVTLDALTDVQFIQEDQHIRLNLTEGTLFLDVKESLDENEGLDIQTTTMTVGIRGTVVFLSVVPSPDGSGYVTRFGVLEGTAEVSYTDTAGASRRMPVSAGQMITSGQQAGDGEGIDPVVTTMTSADIEGFIMGVVESDQSLLNRVTLPPDQDVQGGTDYPAGGNWSYDGTVTLVAQSASKLYDGLPLTRPSNALVYGLPAGFTIDVKASGSRTNAGTSDNEISSWIIRNADGEDVSGHFTNVTEVSGSLVVDKTPLTVWTGSAEKEYDGTPLVNPEAGIRTVEGYSAEEPAWMNTSLVTQTALGSEQMFAVSGHTFVVGTNPFTGETETYDLPVGSSLSVLLHGEGDEQTIEFKIEQVAEMDLSEEVLRLYAANPEMLKRACEEAGWDPDLMAELIAALPPETENMTVSAAGLQVAAETAENIMTDSANVRIHVDSGYTNYNSRPLAKTEANFTPIVLDPSIRVTATGSQTEVGSSENGYEIDWGDADPDNYIVREDLGTLTVTGKSSQEEVMPAVTFTAASESKTYDGTALTAAEVTAVGLPDGYTFSAETSGSQTDAGSSENAVTSVTILDPSGKDVTSRFKSITLTPGTLTVTPASLSITTGSASMVYEGTALTSGDVTVEGLVSGETVTVTPTGTITDAGSVENGCTIEWGTAKASNYDVTLTKGTLTVEPLSLGVNAGGGNVPYSAGSYVPSPVITYRNGSHAGESVSASDAGSGSAGGTVSDDSASVLFRFTLFTSDTVEVTVSGMGTGAGTYSLSASVSSSSPNIDCGGVSVSGTELVIEPAALEISTAAATKAYDGSPLTAGEPEITGLAEGESITATFREGTGSITNAGSVTPEFVIEWGSTESGNYTLTENPGTLTVTQAELTVSTAAATKAYDGTPLTAGEPEITGLADGESISVAVREGTGSVTKPGSVTPEFIIEWGSTDSGKYRCRQ